MVGDITQNYGNINAGNNNQFQQGVFIYYKNESALDKERFLFGRPPERHENFVGRSQEIHEIKSALLEGTCKDGQDRRYAITGIAGIGKTALCTQLLYQHLKDRYAFEFLRTL